MMKRTITTGSGSDDEDWIPPLRLDFERITHGPFPGGWFKSSLPEIKTRLDAVMFLGGDRFNPREQAIVDAMAWALDHPKQFEAIRRPYWFIRSPQVAYNEQAIADEKWRQRRDKQRKDSDVSPIVA